MARPIKEGFDYIPLDVNLDKKVQAIESVFKNDGFVWIIKFWQEAYQNNTGEVLLEGYHGVIHAENSRITLDKQQEIIKMCLEIGLLYKTDSGKYTSNGIQKRIKFLLKERERWRSTHKNELSPTLSTEITPEIRGESKVKESKGKYNIFKPPTLEEAQQFCSSAGLVVDCEDFISFYQAKGWKVGKESMKDWKAAIRRASKWEKNVNMQNDNRTGTYYRP